MTKIQRPIVHGRDHERGGADPVRLVWESVGGPGEAPTASPLILDYFDNNPDPHLIPNEPHGSATVSQNWVRWQEEANWSGYNDPEPWIGVDDVITGTDAYGYDKNSRWILVPQQGTATDFSSYGGNALLKVEFTMQRSNLNAGVVYDVSAHANGTDGYGGTYSYDYSAGGTFGNYGWWSDFPTTYADGYRPTANLTYYQQVDMPGVYYAIGFVVTQTYPDSSYFEYFPYCQCVVTILKNDSFAGERTA